MIARNTCKINKVWYLGLPGSAPFPIGGKLRTPGVLKSLTRMIEKMNAIVQGVGGTMKELEKGTQQITEASENIRLISLQLKTATEEQAEGSKLINEAGENMTERIQEMSRAINEQKEGNETIAKSIHKIHEVTRSSVEMVKQMNKEIEGLVSHADLLNGEVNRFKI